MENVWMYEKDTVKEHDFMGKSMNACRASARCRNMIHHVQITTGVMEEWSDAVSSIHSCNQTFKHKET